MRDVLRLGAQALAIHPWRRDDSGPVNEDQPKLASCAAIASLTDLAANPQYPTAIASSTDVPAANGNPEYCDVQGMIAPQTHFDLPVAGQDVAGPIPAERLRRLLRDG